MGGYLTRDALLGAADLQEEDVDVPEWGGRIKVRGLSLGQYQDVQEKATVGGVLDGRRYTVMLVMAGIVEPALSDDDFEQLRGKALAPIDRIAGRIMILSGLAPGALEDAEATFPEGPGGDVPVPAGPGPADDGGGAG